MEKSNYTKNLLTIILLFISFGVIMIRIVDNHPFVKEVLWEEEKEDYEAGEKRIHAEQKEFEKLLGQTHKYAEFSLDLNAGISPFNSQEIESFADGKIKGKWKRAKNSFRGS